MAKDILVQLASDQLLISYRNLGLSFDEILYTLKFQLALLKEHLGELQLSGEYSEWKLDYELTVEIDSKKFHQQRFENRVKERAEKIQQNSEFWQELTETILEVAKLYVFHSEKGIMQRFQKFTARRRELHHTTETLLDTLQRRGGDDNQKKEAIL